MWLKIEHLKEHVKDNSTMFVVRAFDVKPMRTSDFGYDTDPCCTYLSDIGGFTRWPHPFPPTHFCLLPVVKE